MEYPHRLIVGGAILVVLGFIGLAFRQRLAPVAPTEIPVEPKENRPVTTTTKGKRDDKKPTPTPGNQ